MTCQQHDFSPWVDIPQTFNPFKVRWCHTCGMEEVRAIPRKWVEPHPRDTYDAVDYDYDVEN